VLIKASCNSYVIPISKTKPIAAESARQSSKPKAREKANYWVGSKDGEGITSSNKQVRKIARVETMKRRNEQMLYIWSRRDDCGCYWQDCQLRGGETYPVGASSPEKRKL